MSRSPTDPFDQHAAGYAAGHADGYNEGRLAADITGHLLRPHARHLLAILAAERCEECAEMRRTLEDLLP